VQVRETAGEEGNRSYFEAFVTRQALQFSFMQAPILQPIRPEGLTEPHTGLVGGQALYQLGICEVRSPRSGQCKCARRQGGADASRSKLDELPSFQRWRFLGNTSHGPAACGEIYSDPYGN
jgi:hypothetical protein